MKQKKKNIKMYENEKNERDKYDDGGADPR